MARKLEFVKRSEARIMTFLRQVDSPLKNGYTISATLNIDYCYVMKLLRAMYTKGWIRNHEYEGRRYFNLTAEAPMYKADKVLTAAQQQLRENEHRKTEESSLASTGNEGKREGDAQFPAAKQGDNGRDRDRPEDDTGNNCETEGAKTD